MTWYYADAGRQVGPIEESALDELVRSGVVRDDTLVWCDGMPNWQPHSIARGVRQAPAPMPAVPIAAGSGFCSECGRPYPLNQMVAIGNAQVCAQCKPVYLQRVREGGQAIGARHYGGFWIRFVARVIDTIIIGVVMSLIAIPLGMAIGLGSIATADSQRSIGAALGLIGFYTLLNFFITGAYEVYFVSGRGGTPGKLLLGLQIIRADGSRLSVGQALGRYFAYLLSSFTLTIGFIIAGFDSEKRALHDRICDTRVIYAR